MAIRIFGLFKGSLPAADETWENNDRNRMASVTLVIKFDIVKFSACLKLKKRRYPIRLDRIHASTRNQCYDIADCHRWQLDSAFQRLANNKSTSRRIECLKEMRKIPTEKLVLLKKCISIILNHWKSYFLKVIIFIFSYFLKNKNMNMEMENDPRE